MFCSFLIICSSILAFSNSFFFNSFFRSCKTFSISTSFKSFAEISIFLSSSHKILAVFVINEFFSSFKLSSFSFNFSFNFFEIKLYILVSKILLKISVLSLLSANNIFKNSPCASIAICLNCLALIPKISSILVSTFFIPATTLLSNSNDASAGFLVKPSPFFLSFS